MKKGHLRQSEARILLESKLITLVFKKSHQNLILSEFKSFNAVIYCLCCVSGRTFPNRSCTTDNVEGTEEIFYIISRFPNYRRTQASEATSPQREPHETQVVDESPETLGQVLAVDKKNDYRPLECFVFRSFFAPVFA